MERDRIITPRMVEGMIAEGHAMIVFEGLVLRLDCWLDKHPGGRLAILHMVGRDATDEIKAYHSAATLQTMKAFRIGRASVDPWINTTPPIRGGIYRKHESPCAVTEKNYCTATLDIESLGSERGCPTSICSSLDGINGKARPGQPPNTRWRPCVNGNLPVRNLPIAETASSEKASLTPSQEPKFEYANGLMRREIDQDIQDYPSLDPAVQEDIVRKYRLLHQKVHDEGFYDCPYLEYGKEMARYIGLFIVFIVALRHGWYMTSAAFLGFFWHQIMFSAHDAGHLAITHIFAVDTLIALFIADFCCGLSMGWWKSSHNIHHLVTNHPEHDPDIQNVPLFATSPSFFKSVHSTYYDFTFVWDAAADIMVRYQRYTYYPVMGIARFNLYLLSWLHVISTRSSSLGGSKAWWIRPTEIAFMSGYWFLFGYCLLWRTLPTWYIRIAFVLVSHIITMPLHVQITLSHWGMSTSDLGEAESFPQRQLRATMDVDCPAWLDFIHGGLQFQAVHHLFPRVPRHNLRKLQTLVKGFCQETKIPYSILGFVDGNMKVLSRLGEVSDQIEILVNCQKYMAETGESGLH